VDEERVAMLDGPPKGRTEEVDPFTYSLACHYTLYQPVALTAAYHAPLMSLIATHAATRQVRRADASGMDQYRSDSPLGSVEAGTAGYRRRPRPMRGSHY
jgi:hypothetical protein